MMVIAPAAIATAMEDANSERVTSLIEPSRGDVAVSDRRVGRKCSARGPARKGQVPRYTERPIHGILVHNMNLRGEPMRFVGLDVPAVVAAAIAGAAWAQAWDV